MAGLQARTAAKRTYSLDSGLVTRFEKLVPLGARSQVIEEPLTVRVEQIETERLNTEIKLGLAYMSEVYEDTDCEWQTVEAGGWPAE